MTKKLVLLLLLSTFGAFAAAAATAHDDDEQQQHNMLRQRDLHHQYYYSTCNRVDVPPGMTIVESTRSFDDTYNTLINTLNGIAPIGIVAEIDHQANAQRVGLSLDPTRVVLFGNPALGTPIMQQNIFAGLDLPQKMLVWMEQPNGAVYVGYNEPTSYFVARYGRRLQRLEELETISGALRMIASASAGVEADSIVVAARGRTRLRNRGVFVTYSRFDFETTLNNLLTAIDASPAGVAATVDHAANAASVGLDLGAPESRVIVFGNPNVGTPFMQSAQTAGIDLPLKILVTADRYGHVLVTTNQIGFLQDRHGFCDVDLAMAQMGIGNFIAAATGS